MEKWVVSMLQANAARYETREFLNGDPSWFMHQVDTAHDAELMAFIASCLSYGSRKQFMPKIKYILDSSEGNLSDWLRTGAYNDSIPNDGKCFYRLYSNSTFNSFLSALAALVAEYGTLGSFARLNSADGLAAVRAITAYFADKNVKSGVVPKDCSSACKRVCMFLRWMVRDSSPVDLGLWSGIIDKRTLIMPMDTHVVNQAYGLGLLGAKSATMSSALKLTAKMREVFPDDPLKGDFALFGYGVDEGNKAKEGQ